MNRRLNSSADLFHYADGSFTLSRIYSLLFFSSLKSFTPPKKIFLSASVFLCFSFSLAVHCSHPYLSFNLPSFLSCSIYLIWLLVRLFVCGISPPNFCTFILICVYVLAYLYVTSLPNFLLNSSLLLLFHNFNLACLSYLWAVLTSPFASSSRQILTFWRSPSHLI